VSTNVSQREALLPSGADENILIVTPTYHSYANRMGCCSHLLWRHAFDPATLSPRGYAAHHRGHASRCRRKPDIVRRPDGARGVRHDKFREPPPLLSGASALPTKPCAAGSATRCTICEGYGQSEAGPVLTFNPRDGIRKQGSVGVPVPLTDVQIVAPRPARGRLSRTSLAKSAPGPQIMSGYRNRPEETRRRSGTAGSTPGTSARSTRTALCSSSTARKTWRSSVVSMSIRGRSRALCAHPAVAEAAVIGVPDSYRGEALIGYVVLRQPDASERRPDQLSRQAFDALQDSP